ncbi:Cytohesin-4 [Varanus komodoensis]|nr:Cytohesin-4 [Varanus komodoensis]
MLTTSLGLSFTIELCQPFLENESPDLNETEATEIEIIKKHKTGLLEDIQKINDEIAEILKEINNFQQTQTSKMIQRDKDLCTGRKKFNMDPAKGIRHLIESKVLSSDAQEIAKFLYQGEGLSKTAIGEYLGQRDAMNLQVLQAFVECHEFANLNLVQALRQFLWSFRLPGEAQKIDRMMEAFATRYCQCNPGVFQSTGLLSFRGSHWILLLRSWSWDHPVYRLLFESKSVARHLPTHSLSADTCYILSFSVIMLNTSLHNPNVKDKPPFERFVSMNRGIDEGGDLHEALLRVRKWHAFPFSLPVGSQGIKNTSLRMVEFAPTCYLVLAILYRSLRND